MKTPALGARVWVCAIRAIYLPGFSFAAAANRFAAMLHTCKTLAADPRRSRQMREARRRREIHDMKHRRSFDSSACRAANPLLWAGLIASVACSAPPGYGDDFSIVHVWEEERMRA